MLTLQMGPVHVVDHAYVVTLVHLVLNAIDVEQTVTFLYPKPSQPTPVVDHAYVAALIDLTLDTKMSQSVLHLLHSDPGEPTPLHRRDQQHAPALSAAQV